MAQDNNLNLLVAALGGLTHEMSEAIRKSGRLPGDNRHIVRLSRILDGARNMANGKGDAAREAFMEACDG